jgi:hypothetical protein
MNFASAQIIYLSHKKSSNGLMIGAEVFNPKTKVSLKPFGYNYEWTVPDISLESQKTTKNILFIPLSRLSPSLLIDLQVRKPFSKEIYSFKNQKIFFKEPRVKIVRKDVNGIIFPLSGQVKKNESLVVNVQNFASKNLTYVWEFNGIFVSNSKELFIANLKEKSGAVKIKVFGTDLRERAEDIQRIQIE